MANLTLPTVSPREAQGERGRAAKSDELLIHEIYASIQGESSFAGLPCTFIRTTGCNLRCTWCDTTEAFGGGEKMSIAAVRRRALELDTPLVELTGGEPLLQAGVLTLMEQLADDGKTVLIETSGERDISTVDPRVHRIVDLKPPGSGEVARNRWENLAVLTPRDELKFVLADRVDYDWMVDVIAKHDLARGPAALLASCAFGLLAPSDLVAWVVEDKLSVRVQLQLHKYIWGGDASGV